MHVIGARFTDLGDAIAALHAIRASVAVEPPDVGVRPLGSTRYDQPVEAYLLAGRFAGPDVDAVAAILEDHGGLVLARFEEWTPRRTISASAPAPPATPQRERAPRCRGARPACPVGTPAVGGRRGRQ